MAGWRVVRTPDGALRCGISARERAVVADLVQGVVDLLGGREVAAGDPLDRLGATRGPVAAPEDPAVRRLLPDASRDPDDAAELRRLTEADVRADKVGNLLRLHRALTAPGPHLVLAADDVPGSAAALTDVRLVVASRLGVADDAAGDAVVQAVMDPGAPEPWAGADDPDLARWLAAVYVALGVLQESLVEDLLARLDAAPDDGSAGAGDVGGRD